MKAAIAGLLGLTCLMGVDARAAGLCNCCGAATDPSCSKACEPVQPSAGQCVATVDFHARSTIAPNHNPLYEIPLRNMWLDETSEYNLELFRRLLEKARKGAESDRKRALRARRNASIDDATAHKLAKRYDDAIVNYYLGTHAYRKAKNSGS